MSTEPKKIPLFTKSEIISLIPAGQISSKKIVFWIFSVVSVVVSVVVICVCRGNITDQRVYNLASPAILGTLSLIITLHARNVSISDRLRALGADVTKSVLDRVPRSRVGPRLESIKLQVPDLYARYKLNLYSLAAISANLLIMPIVAISIPLVEVDANGTKPETLVPIQTVILIAASSAMFTFAAVSTVVDLVLSFRTIETNMECTENEIQFKEGQREKIDVGDLSAVVHFNKLYHSIWYVLKADLEREVDSNRKTDLSEQFFNRYFGMWQEEVHFFRNQLIPETLFRQWIDCLRNNAVTRQPNRADGLQRNFGGKGIIDWWKLNQDSFQDKVFQDFVDMTFEITRDANRGNMPYTIEEILETLKKNIY